MIINLVVQYALGQHSIRICLMDGSHHLTFIASVCKAFCYLFRSFTSSFRASGKICQRQLHKMCEFTELS